VGRPIYLPQGTDAPEGYVAQGTAFYASDIPTPTAAAIHRWEDPATGDFRYAATSPDPDLFEDAGVAFYAPVDLPATEGLNTPYVPVYRWDHEGAQRYSALDLSQHGFARREVAFYSPCPDSDADSLDDCRESSLGTNAFATDTDRDGCADAAEISSVERTGGDRDPTNFWDFYDTPDNNGHRDRSVSASDLARVLFRYGTRGDPTGDPLSGDPISRGYHVAFDRGGSAAGVRHAAPDGILSGGDIGGVVRDYANTCMTSPAS
jgi:hypothetical protein